MKIGKIPEQVLNRSVLAVLKNRNDAVVCSAAVGEDCAAVRGGADEVFALSTDPITGTKEDVGRLAVLITVNDIASSGAQPIGIMLSILLPPRISEAKLKRIMEDAEEEAARANIQIMGGHTEVTDAVNKVIITATGIGRVATSGMVKTSGVRPMDDIIATKWIALEGTSILAKEKREALLQTLPPELVDRAAGFDDQISVLPEARIAADFGVHAMHDVTEGGIFGALWEIAEASGVGLDIDARSIPVKQETIEICERFDLNPYGLISSGSLLIAVPNGTALVDRLEASGIHAAIIGRATAGTERIVHMDETDRILTPPEADELYKLQL